MEKTRKKKEHPIDDYVPVRTNKDRACVRCGGTVPAGGIRMMPRGAKSGHCVCPACFKEWESAGGELKLTDDLGDVRKERVIHMSKIMKGDCDIVKGRRLYVAMRKAIDEKRIVAIRFDADQPICISTRVMNPSFGTIMDEYGKDIFQGNLRLINVPKGAKDLIIGYIEKYSKS